MTDSPELYRKPVEMLQNLIRFDTTNPPGNESECVAYIRRLLAGAGVEAKILAKSPDRPNLIARLPGRGDAPPFLLYGHVDVVTTENQEWRHPPFEGKIADGFVWGRGALDMKGGVAMMLSAFLRAKAEGLTPAGDVILAVLSDEEACGDFGARFLVERHPEEFSGVRYAIGEFGGFTQYVGKRRFYPIQVAEKTVVWFRAVFRGPSGHGSMPVRSGAMAKLARFLKRVDDRPLPVHITSPARLMVGAMASSMGGAGGLVMRQLLNPLLTDGILKLLGETGRVFAPLLHNTVSPTVLTGSGKINVIPNKVSVGVDGRVLPGFKPDDLFRELRAMVGEDVEFDIDEYDPGPPEPDMKLFDTLGGILKEADPEGVPIPLFLSGVTDGRLFARLGVQSYGFTPMRLPEGFAFTRTIHGADERIPVEALEFGANAVFKALQRIGA